MEQKQNNHHGSGFLAGVIVGVVITLLFTTKKGREIFKETVDKVIDKFNDVKSDLDEEVTLDEVEGDDYVKPEPAPTPTPKEPKKEVRYLASESPEEVAGEAEEIEIEDVPEEKEAPKKSSPVRKFFKLKKN